MSNTPKYPATSRGNKSEPLRMRQDIETDHRLHGSILPINQQQKDIQVMGKFHNQNQPGGTSQ